MSKARSKNARTLGGGANSKKSKGKKKRHIKKGVAHAWWSGCLPSCRLFYFNVQQLQKQKAKSKKMVKKTEHKLWVSGHSGKAFSLYNQPKIAKIARAKEVQKMKNVQDF